MIDAFKSFITRSSRTDKHRPDSGISHEELQVATCALLLEIAHADDSFSAEEERRIAELMHTHFSIPEDQFMQIKKISEARRRDSIDLWQFTHIIKQHYSAADKQKVIEMIWSVIYADGTLDQHEDHLVHQLATLLGLDQRQLIDAKVNVLRNGR